MSNLNTVDTIPEPDITKLAIRIPKSTIDRLKIQAICEGVSTEELSTKIFDAYLETPKAKALRKEIT